MLQFVDYNTRYLSIDSLHLTLTNLEEICISLTNTWVIVS